MPPRCCRAFAALDLLENGGQTAQNQSDEERIRWQRGKFIHQRPCDDVGENRQRGNHADNKRQQRHEGLLELLKEVGDAVNQRIVDAHGNHHCAAGYAGDDVGKPNYHAFEDVNEEFHAFHSLIYWKGFSENHHTMICRS